MPFLAAATVQEEAELTVHLPRVEPMSTHYYSFPSVNALFPDITTSKLPLKLHLASVNSSKTQDPADKARVWSQGLDLQSQYDTFASIPGGSDVKVHIEKVGHTSHVFIDPVSRAEISAKEIRSRIRGKDTVILEAGPGKLEDPETSAAATKVKVAEDRIQEDKSQDLKEFRKNLQQKVIQVMSIDVSFVCSQACFLLLDEITCPSVVSEVVRVTVDNLVLLLSPLDTSQALTTRQPHFFQTLILALGNVQIDNQCYGRRNYDFPVILVKQEDPSQPKMIGIDEEFFSLGVGAKYQYLMDRCFLLMSSNLCNDVSLSSNRNTVVGVNIAMKPLTLFLEDTFAFDTVKIVDKIIPLSLSRRSSPRQSLRAPPASVLATAAQLTHPVSLQYFNIEPVSLLLSVHASLALFIASDNSPLTFQQFEKEGLFTSSNQLIRSLTVHYVSGALFRAGGGVHCNIAYTYIRTQL